MHILTFVECLPCVYIPIIREESLPLLVKITCAGGFLHLLFSMGAICLSLMNNSLLVASPSLSLGALVPWLLHRFLGFPSLLRLRSYLARSLIELSRKSLPGNGKSFVRWDIGSFLPWQMLPFPCLSNLATAATNHPNFGSMM